MLQNGYPLVRSVVNMVRVYNGFSSFQTGLSDERFCSVLLRAHPV